jgi:hypothetical protein
LAGGQSTELDWVYEMATVWIVFFFQPFSKTELALEAGCVTRDASDDIIALLGIRDTSFALLVSVLFRVAIFAAFSAVGFTRMFARFAIDGL